MERLAEISLAQALAAQSVAEGLQAYGIGVATGPASAAPAQPWLAWCGADSGAADSGAADSGVAAVGAAAGDRWWHGAYSGACQKPGHQPVAQEAAPPTTRVATVPSPVLVPQVVDFVVQEIYGPLPVPVPVMTMAAAPAAATPPALVQQPAAATTLFCGGVADGGLRGVLRPVPGAARARDDRGSGSFRANRITDVDGGSRLGHSGYFGIVDRGVFACGGADLQAGAAGRLTILSGCQQRAPIF